MCQVTVTTAAPPMTVVCSSPAPITMTVAMAPTVNLAALYQHDVILLPPLILRDTVRGSVGLTTMPLHQ